MARVVGAGAGDDGQGVAHLPDGELDHPHVLVVGQRRGLPRRPAHDQAVGPVVRQVVHQVDRGLLVHALLRVERGDHRGEDRAQVRHRAPIIASCGATGDVAGILA
jgi:hypothetical protein